MIFGEDDRKAFFEALDKGERCQVTEGVFDEFLDMLPPRFMYRTVALCDGSRVYASFGHGEGEGPTIAFWCATEGNQDHWYAQNVMRQKTA